MSNFLSVNLSKSISFPLLSLVQMVESLSQPGHAGSSARVCELISPGMWAHQPGYAGWDKELYDSKHSALYILFVPSTVILKRLRFFTSQAF